MVKRDLHRHYITTPKWQSFRKQALAHYGAICNRCKSHGTDVHHKTYRNWGNEKLEDVEILCRPCHEAEEAMKRSTRKSKGKPKPRKEMHLRAIWAYMTGKQRRMVMEKFGIEAESTLNIEITHANGMSDILKHVCMMMKVRPYGFPRPNPEKSHKKSKTKSVQEWEKTWKGPKKKKKRAKKLQGLEKNRVISKALVKQEPLTLETEGRLYAAAKRSANNQSDHRISKVCSCTA